MSLPDLRPRDRGAAFSKHCCAVLLQILCCQFSRLVEQLLQLATPEYTAQPASVSLPDPALQPKTVTERWNRIASTRVLAVFHGFVILRTVPYPPSCRDRPDIAAGPQSQVASWWTARPSGCKRHWRVLPLRALQSSSRASRLM